MGRWAVALGLTLAGCTGDDLGAGNDPTSATTGHGSAHESDDTAAAGDDSSGTATAGPSQDTGTTAQTDDATGSATASGSDSGSTGGTVLCGITPADTPSFEVYQGADALPEDDAAIRLTCGVQGAFMMPLRLDIFGIDTMGEAWVPVLVTLDVDGFDKIEGRHFMERDTQTYVGCDQLDGFIEPGYLNLVIPDAITNPAVVDGAAATIEIVMLPDTADPLTFTASGTMVAQDRGGWAGCAGGSAGYQPASPFSSAC